MLVKLDAYLENNNQYIEQKETKIDKWRQHLGKAVSNEKRYEASIHLFEEYKSYKYDSAYTYAHQSLLLAQQLQNQGYVVEANYAIAFCLLSSGLFKVHSSRC